MKISEIIIKQIYNEIDKASNKVKGTLNDINPPQIELQKL